MKVSTLLILSLGIKDLKRLLMFNIKSLSLLLIFAITSACSTVPGTGRSQLTLIPSGQMLSMSYSQYSETIKGSKLSKDKKTTEMVRNVGVRIARAVEDLIKEEGVEMKFDWEFNVIEDDKQVNAWCMPGGKIAVYTGILKYTKDEAGLAVVMGHEVAHAVADHGNERMTEGIGLAALSLGLTLGTSDLDPATRNIFLGAFGAGASVGVMLPFSRSHETEADKLGLLLMARAGYDPNAAIPFWKRMAQSGGEKPPEFLSTHPSNETRIRNIEEFLPEALMYYFPQRNR